MYRLAWLVGAEAITVRNDAEHAWRSWVDEVVASWAASLLTTPGLAEDAVEALAGCEHTAGLSFDFRRLAHPDGRIRQAAVLLRHPDLLAPITGLHHAGLSGATALDQARSAGRFTPVHDAWWAAEVALWTEAAS